MYCVIIIETLALLWFIFLKEGGMFAKKKDEDEFFSKENQLRTLIDNIPDFIYIKNEKSQFIVANKFLADVLGNKNPKDMEGLSDHDYYEKKLADAFREDEIELMRMGVPLLQKIEHGKDKYNNDILVSTTKIPLKRADGKVVGLAGIGRDVTEYVRSKQKVEEQAKILQDKNAELEEQSSKIKKQKNILEMQWQQLKKINASKDKLFSIIGHDLKNPFNSITLISEYLTHSFSELKEDEIIDLINSIYISSENASCLLENLLQWSKAQTDRLKFEPEEINLKDIITSSIDFLKVNVEQKNILIQNNLLKQSNIVADKNMVFFIFRNLINNAVKFTPKGGIITVTSEIKEKYVEISVKDTGIGMNENTLQQLFKPGEQKTHSGTNGEPSSGLGLVICDEFIRRHHGEMKIQSQLGVGSTFTVRLPLVTQVEEKAQVGNLIGDKV